MGQDLTYALRALRQSPGFAVMAVGMMALGIAANTVMFTSVDRVLLRPLPYPDPERLVLLWGSEPQRGQLRSQVSATNIADYRAQAPSFEEVSTFGTWTAVLTGHGDAERLPGMQVGDGYFRVVGVEPRLGRTFEPGEQQPGSDRVVILSHAFWASRFGADPQVVGRSITLGGRPHEVVGVLGPDVQPLPRSLVGEAPAFYRPVAEPPDDSQRDARHLRAIGRLRQGVTLGAAQAEVDAIAGRLARDYPEQNAGSGIRLVPLTEDTVGGLRAPLLAVLGAVAMVLLIACANVANLMLARATGRTREMSIRSALGATRPRLFRQLLTESLLLGSLGGAAGLLLAAWGVGLVPVLASGVEPLLSGLHLDGRVVVFAIALSLLTGVVSGLAPAWQVSGAGLMAALREGTGGSGGRRQRRLRAGLVVAEVAVAMVLVIGAGLLLRSVVNLRAVDPGFRPERLLTMNLWLSYAKYPQPAQQVAFFRRALGRVEALPGVESAAAVSVLPMGSNFDRVGIAVEGRTYPPERTPDPDRYVVTPGYFRTLSIPLRRGRLLDDGDVADSTPVVVIGETMARSLWPGQEAVGRRIRLPWSPGETNPFRTVVGVVGDTRQYGLDRPGTMQLYLPQAQYGWGLMTVVVRTAGDPRELAGPVRRALREIDPEQATFAVATMRELLAGSIARQRLFTSLLGGFAGAALLLAALGLYGVVAHAVGHRRREIGIRMALGAKVPDLLRMVLAQGLRLAVAGVLLGVAAGLGLTRVLGGLLFGVGPADPVTFGAVAALLVAVAAAASYFPARRAAAVDPVVALRQE